MKTQDGLYCGFIHSIKVEKFLRGTETHAASQRNPKSSSSNRKVRGLMNDDKNKRKILILIKKLKRNFSL